ncbi:MAG: peptidoglycan DD-metalloendopeptidase family protein [Candidatus Micrarchaeota archaeon]|nr:peptidoglycan DD-metalloendopeptidase family protein [Candidatus Micrarchaeota archaeon]
MRPLAAFGILAVFAVLAVYAAPFAASAESFTPCPKTEVCAYPGFIPEKIIPKLPPVPKASVPVASSAAPSASGPQYICPVTVTQAAELTSPISDSRRHPKLGVTRPHNGLDIGKPIGTPVKATAAGTVTGADYDSSTGKYVLIRHAGGFESKYFHLNRHRAKAGDVVKQGDVVGEVGETGEGVTGPHLHFEMWNGNQRLRTPEVVCQPGRTAATAPTSAPSSLNVAAVKIVTVAQCAKAAESACPAIGSAQYAGKTWKTADVNCVLSSVGASYGIPPALLRAQMNQESGGRQFVGSGAGAQGYMQLIPSTAEGLGIGASQLFDPYYNICGGARYLAGQLKTFGNLECALAAYNAGPGNVKQNNPDYCRSHPIAETRNYVVAITSAYSRAA